MAYHHPPVIVLRKRVTADATLVYACVDGSRRRIKLGREGCFPDRCDLGPFATGGSVIAYGLSYLGRGFPYYRIEVRSLATGKVWQREVPAVGNDRGPAPDTSRGHGIRAIAVTHTGAAAWLIRNPYTAGSPYEVWRSDRRGRQLLDAGSDLDPARFYAFEGTLHWGNDASERKATLR